MNFTDKLKRSDYRTIGIVLIIKILILGFAAQSFMIVTDQPLKNFYAGFELWRRWDAVSYLRIADFGYTATGDDRFLIVFFPLFPALTALVRLVVRDTLISAFLVSGVASVLLGLVFKKLVRLDHSEKTAQLAVLFMFIFPTAFFLHIPYTESLFLALAVGAFFFARRRKWLLAGILGYLAGLTRVNGLVLLPALVFEVWDEYRETRAINRRWLALLLIPAGFASYLALNYLLTGKATMFLTHQREHWGKYLRFPAYGLWDAAKVIYWKKPSPAIMEGFQELLFVGIGLAAIIFGWRHLRNSYRVWMIANWLIFVSTSFILSVPRYTLILFPMFILMAIVARVSRTAFVIFVVWSGLYLSLFITQFARGWWAF